MPHLGWAHIHWAHGPASQFIRAAVTQSCRHRLFWLWGLEVQEQGPAWSSESAQLVPLLLPSPGEGARELHGISLVRILLILSGGLPPHHQSSPKGPTSSYHHLWGLGFQHLDPGPSFRPQWVLGHTWLLLQLRLFLGQLASCVLGAPALFPAQPGGSTDAVSERKGLEILKRNLRVSEEPS